MHKKEERSLINTRSSFYLSEMFHLQMLHCCFGKSSNDARDGMLTTESTSGEISNFQNMEAYCHQWQHGVTRHSSPLFSRQVNLTRIPAINVDGLLFGMLSIEVMKLS